DAVGALQHDLRRLRAHEPVQALPQTAVYVAAKLLRRRWPWVTAGAAAVLMAAGFTVRVVQERNEAQFQRQQAEGLIEFMLGDLRKKLEPVGRLDVLDSLGERVLSHYGERPDELLSAAELSRRARSLHLVGEIAQLRGQAERRAQALARAAATTEALLAQVPDDPQRIFDHAQSVFWVGSAAFDAGDLKSAEAAFRSYAAFADRLVAIDAGKREWAMEQAWAKRNLAAVYVRGGRSAEAIALLDASQRVWAEIARGDPGLVFEWVDDLGWLAEAREQAVDYRGAIAARQSIVSVLEQPALQQDARTTRRRQIALRRLASLELSVGNVEAALAHAQRAEASSAARSRDDPADLVALAELAFSRAQLAEVLRHARPRADADRVLAALRADVDRLLAADSGRTAWQLLDGMAWRLAASTAETADQRRRAAQGMTAFLDRVTSRPPGSDRGGWSATTYEVAATAFELGQLRAAMGDRYAALSYWQTALDRLTEEPMVQAPARLLLAARAHLRLGDLAAARWLAAQMAMTPYRHPDVALLQRELTDGAVFATTKGQRR
ncbi:MAG: hypothetical protein ACK54C_00150, partial [Betaproteobacteria bacterium]